MQLHVHRGGEGLFDCMLLCFVFPNSAEAAANPATWEGDYMEGRKQRNTSAYVVLLLVGFSHVYRAQCSPSSVLGLMGVCRFPVGEGGMHGWSGAYHTFGWERVNSLCRVFFNAVLWIFDENDVDNTDVFSCCRLMLMPSQGLFCFLHCPAGEGLREHVGIPLALGCWALGVPAPV